MHAFARFTALPLLRTSAVALAVTLAGAAVADTYSVAFTAPSLDRWNYPFNPTPGTRITASTFGNDPLGVEFDNRDGQFIVGFDTGAQVPAGLGASTYTVESCVVTITFANDFVVEYDPTTDPFTAFLPPSDPAYADDADAGQPIELFGTGFRSGYSLANWIETTPYSFTSPLLASTRLAFAQGTNSKGQRVDVSNSVRERWTPAPFAVGAIDGLKPGELVPAGTVMRFELDVARADVQSYLRDAVDAGKLRLTATSLTKVVQQGGNFPAFYCRENPLVVVTGEGDATLSMTVSTASCVPADLDCNGAVNAADLAALLVAWNGSGPADLNGDGLVGAADLAILLGAWTN
jgi:hypothetical protein